MGVKIDFTTGKKVRRFGPSFRYLTERFFESRINAWERMGFSYEEADYLASTGLSLRSAMGRMYANYRRVEIRALMRRGHSREEAIMIASDRRAELAEGRYRDPGTAYADRYKWLEEDREKIFGRKGG